MNYKKIYDAIIERGKNRTLTGYRESHHIVPKCLNGTDDKDNLVSLTPEEHYLCHLLLVKIYPNNIKLVKAAMFMVSSNNNVKRNNKAYGWLKRQYSNYMKGPNNPSTKNGTWNRGIPVKLRKTKLTSLEKSLHSSRMKDKNPCAGVKPWNHPRATDYSKSVWKKADVIYQIWIDNNKPSYCKLYTLLNEKCYTNESKVIGPYMNMVKYFRNGWIPMQDIDWINI
jgi:hypothetical protein